MPLAGCFSPFPHGTGSLSVAEGIEPWRVVPPASHKLTGVRGTQDTSRTAPVSLYGIVTLSDGSFQNLRVSGSVVLLVLPPQSLLRGAGLGSSRFARHYYGNLG